jgi:hypothetical protein
VNFAFSWEVTMLPPVHQREKSLMVLRIIYLASHDMMGNTDFVNTAKYTFIRHNCNQDVLNAS